LVMLSVAGRNVLSTPMVTVFAVGVGVPFPGLVMPGPELLPLSLLAPPHAARAPANTAAHKYRRILILRGLTKLTADESDGRQESS
jgi:hypothetical protein